MSSLLHTLAGKVKPLCPVGLGGPGINGLGDRLEDRNLILLDDLEALDRVLDRFLPPRPAASR